MGVLTASLNEEKHYTVMWNADFKLSIAKQGT